MSPKTRPILLCVPIYFDDGYYPSAGDLAGQRLIYWRTIAVLCASVRRSKTPQLDLLICTNETPPPEVHAILDKFGVKFAGPNFSFRAPKGLSAAFTGAFYLLDSMDYCRRTYASETIFVFIDPDCIVMNSLDLVRQFSGQWPLIGYALDMEKESEVNGCSRNDLLTFLRKMVPSHSSQPPLYFGGELLVVAGEQLPDLCEKIDRIWKRNLQAFHSGENSLKTEEHVISVALALCEGHVGNANDFTKRMWTRPSFRNVSPADKEYTIWHLPAEKRHAFLSLFRNLERDTEALTSLSDNDFRDLVSQQIQLKLPFIKKPIYFIYPKLKNLARLASRSSLRTPRSRFLSSATIRGTQPSLLGTHAIQPVKVIAEIPYTAVVLATKGRAQVVGRLLDSLEGQTVRPNAIIVSACSRGDIEEDRIKADNIQILFGSPGLTAQRNRALAVLREKADIVIFFDDDFLPSRFWIERVQTLLESQPDVGGVTGRLLADGVRVGEISWADGQSIVDSADVSQRMASIDDYTVENDKSPYGCNMAFRTKAIEELEFDERLALYGWLEDRDFGARVATKARLICTNLLWGVHLGARSGRTPELRFGYSQIVNPWYLMNKGTMRPIEVYGYIIRGLARNVLGAFFPTFTVDRWGRLQGNLLGLRDVISGRWAPEKVADVKFPG